MLKDRANQVGAFNRSCVGTLVERKTRFVVLCRMDGCTAG
ncbi:transposase, partial [Xanthomonas oryzae pv. oryzae]